MPYELFPGRRMFMRRRSVVPFEDERFSPLFHRFNRHFPWRRRFW